MKNIQNIKRFILILILFSSVIARAQMEPLLSQYMMNGMIINPAYTGADEYTQVNFTASDQWVGLANPPRTYWGNFETSLMDKKIGLGGIIYSDRDGLLINSGIQINYAYHILLKNKMKLSLGLYTNFNQLKLDKADAQVSDITDPILNGSNVRIYGPDAGLGVLLKNNMFFAGFSINQLFKSGLNIERNELSGYTTDRYFYLVGGSNHSINNDFLISPSVLIKTPQNLNLQADISTKVTYKGQFWGGLTYRTNNDIIVFVGVIYKQFNIGYAVDFTTSEIRTHTYGSHEISISIMFGKSAQRFKQQKDY